MEETLESLLEKYPAGQGIIRYRIGEEVKHRFVVAVEEKGFGSNLRRHLGLVCPTAEFIDCAVKTNKGVFVG